MVVDWAGEEGGGLVEGFLLLLLYFPLDEVRVIDYLGEFEFGVGVELKVDLLRNIIIRL